ncbi:hypothetical protein [Thiobacillus sp.]
MEEKLLRELAEQYLVPFISGSELLPDTIESTKHDKLVGSFDPCTIHFKAEKADHYRLALRRSQHFDKVGSGRVIEKHVVDAFVEAVNDIKGGLNSPYKSDLLSSLQRRIVSKAICGTSIQPTLITAIDNLNSWSTRLYEGKPISISLGLIPESIGEGPLLSEAYKHDFGSVLTNGYDTLLTFDINGYIHSHESLLSHTPTPSYAPYRQAQIAAWSENGKIGITLNRLGEILIFKDQKLLFARRSGIWHFLIHEPTLAQIKKPNNIEVRKAIYESCLDASFARTGACIGVVTSKNTNKWKEIVPSEADHLQEQTSAKSKTISKIIGNKKFQDLDRRLRQELLAIDGATILSYEGTVLAVGAILRIPGGSTGGGRLAAAKALSNLGLGIKISQDGGIQGFYGDSPAPQFSIM